jgi:hypothetical protein
MPDSYRVFRSIGDVDLVAWESVRSASGSSIFMDPRFIAAVESSMKQTHQFWHVIVYNGSGCPAACASVCTMTIDLADLVGPPVASIIRRIPKGLSRFRQMRGLFCGLPGSPGEKSLGMMLTDASPRILRQLDEIICNLAEHSGMDLVAYKEFGNDDLPWLDALQGLGYRRICTPPMHFFNTFFPDFEHYCAALPAHYRQSIVRSKRKLRAAGLETRILTDVSEILQLYVPEVHALYYQVVSRAKINIDTLPIEFFRQLALQLSGQLELIVISKDSKIVAIGWCLHAGSAYYALYLGLDYQVNRDFDLYFNMMYAMIDSGLRKRVSAIYLGQTATTFKARLGCYSEPLYAFVKGQGPLMSRLVRYTADFVLAETKANPPSNVFRKMEGSARPRPHQRKQQQRR